MFQRMFVGLVLVILLPGIILAFLFFGRMLLDMPPWAIYAGLGAAVGILLDAVLLSKIPGLETFEHELTHSVASLIFFRRVTRFVTTHYDGGYVEHTGGFGGTFGDDFIGLAPYFFPTFTVASVLVHPFLGSGWFPWFDLWIGFTFGYHVWSTVKETRRSWTKNLFLCASGQMDQTDIARRGFVFSFIYITALTLAIHTVLLVIMLKGYSGLPVWWYKVWLTTKIVLAGIVSHAENVLKVFHGK
ncbi:MAG: hypothetical protein ABFD82_03855 [Syntrophaceae bacterium]